MKKALFLAIVALFAGITTVSASTVSFSWGANFFTPNNAGLPTFNGNASHLDWYVDDFGYGVRTETNTVALPAGPGTIAVSEVTFDKWINKSIAVGVGIGSSTTSGTGFAGVGTNPLIDVRGIIQLLSGKGEKINASLDFNITARWNATAGLSTVAAAVPSVTVANLNGVVATLSVTLGL